MVTAATPHQRAWPDNRSFGTDKFSWTFFYPFHPSFRTARNYYSTRSLRRP